MDEYRSEPWRPYHPHTDPDPVEPGEIEEYRIEILPIANVFDPGHRLQLEIWPMDYPAEEYHDETLFWGRVNHVPYGEEVVYDVYHDSTNPSSLLVPIIEDPLSA